jgi:N utilization substance protein B
VVEALYRHELVGAPVEEVAREVLERNRHPEERRELTLALVEGWRQVGNAADDLLQRHVQHWSMDRIRPLEKAILRTAIVELLEMDTPVPVVINEAVELAKDLVGEEAASFINGVLDAVARELQHSP